MTQLGELGEETHDKWLLEYSTNCVLLMLHIWGLADAGEIVPPRANQFLERVNHSPVRASLSNSQPAGMQTCECLSNANQPIHSPYSTIFFTELAQGSLTGSSSTCPNHQGQIPDSPGHLSGLRA